MEENSNKCERKDGELISCNYMNNALMNKSINVSRSGDLIIGQLERPSYVINNCPWCAADIRKPEPEQPIVKKRGGTFVCRFKDIDYLCIDSISCNGKSRSLEMEFEKMPQIWKEISKIKITDEIAKSNPLVSVRDFRNNYNLYELIGVKNNTVISWDGTDTILSAIHDVEIATIEIIENLED